MQAELFGQERPDAARQMSVRMVGTVNSVCGPLLQEYAVDAGLSPALQVIAEDEQLRIFQLATDDVFAEFTPRIQPLARRLGYDGESDIRGTDPDWRKIVRDITDAARGNKISPAELAHSVSSSWPGLQQVLGPVSPDDRASRSNQLLQGLMSMRGMAADLIEGGKNPPKNLIASITLLEPVLSQASPEDAPWRFWIDGAAVGNAEAKRLLESYISAVETDLESNPAFQTELREITIVFACAASCLDRFAEFKRKYGLIDFADQETLVLDLLENNPEFRPPSRAGSSSWWWTSFRTRVLCSSSCSPSSPSSWTRWSGWATRSRPSTNSAARTQSAVGGSREAWTLAAKKVPEQHRAIAAGVADLIQRRGFKGSDVAVLAGSNAAVKAIAAEVTAPGLKATTNDSSLLTAREVQLVRAGMAFVASNDDTVALAELAHLHPEHTEFGRWVPALFVPARRCPPHQIVEQPRNTTAESGCASPWIDVTRIMISVAMSACSAVLSSSGDCMMFFLLRW